MHLKYCMSYDIKRDMWRVSGFDGKFVFRKYFKSQDSAEAYLTYLRERYER